MKGCSNSWSAFGRNAGFFCRVVGERRMPRAEHAHEAVWLATLQGEHGAVHSPPGTALTVHVTQALLEHSR